MLKAILMDYTGTLLRQAGAEIEEMILRVTQHSDFASPGEAMAFWFSRLEALEEGSFGERFRTQDAFCLELLELCEREHGLREDREALHRLNQGLWRNGPLYEDAAGFFARCPLPVYIITNNGAEYLQENFKKNGIAPAGIVSAEDVRAYKPRPEIFAEALRRAGCAADEVIHVGDSYAADYLGAAKLGIRCILVDRRGRDGHDCEKVRDLREILDRIR